MNGEYQFRIDDGDSAVDSAMQSDKNLASSLLTDYGLKVFGEKKAA